ncbi:FirrV-1-B10 [Feldmannia irregularis virus a]|uniref:FirrV-1-B10 n=1 Tax=Feldmannia irregularis virus a TaxID=231992 RepID=Q6XM26_9PHYC|nr:FirrV-1-B10 [Feldmannia irregularis virus a]AAR26885.1 FirrV-1-B10 [Feldmannia irregularis virus a]
MSRTHAPQQHPTMAATHFSEFDVSTLKLSPPKTSKANVGCKTAYITAVGSVKIAIQTPIMTLPWDIVPKKLDDVSNVRAELSLSFVGINEDDPENELKKFKDFLSTFDQKIKTLISETHGAMGKNSEDTRLEASFRDSIKESATGNYPPTIQSKIWLNLKQGGSPSIVEDFDMDVMVFDLEGCQIQTDQMQKGCPAAAILEPSYVWCSALGVGITWVAKQVALQPKSASTFGFNLGKNVAEHEEHEEHEES